MSKIDEVVAAVSQGVGKPLPEAARTRSQHHPGQDVRAAASAEMAQTSRQRSLRCPSGEADSRSLGSESCLKTFTERFCS